MRDDLVDLELTVLVEVEQIGHLYPWAGRAEYGSQKCLVVHGEVEEIQLDVRLIEGRDRRDHDAGILRPESARRSDEFALEHAGREYHDVRRCALWSARAA